MDLRARSTEKLHPSKQLVARKLNLERSMYIFSIGRQAGRGRGARVLSVVKYVHKSNTLETQRGQREQTHQMTWATAGM